MATDTRQIWIWMKANYQDHVDPVTHELDCTGLVEAWDRECSTGGATLDPGHIAWDVAIDIDSWYESFIKHP